METNNQVECEHFYEGLVILDKTRTLIPGTALDWVDVKADARACVLDYLKLLESFSKLNVIYVLLIFMKADTLCSNVCFSIQDIEKEQWNVEYIDKLLKFLPSCVTLDEKFNDFLKEVRNSEVTLPIAETVIITKPDSIFTNGSVIEMVEIKKHIEINSFDVCPIIDPTPSCTIA